MYIVESVISIISLYFTKPTLFLILIRFGQVIDTACGLYAVLLTLTLATITLTKAFWFRVEPKAHYGNIQS